MTQPAVSVVIVSNGRPDLLRRCLTGVFQLDYPAFEVVVVADTDGIAAVSDQGDQIKQIVFDDANISAARNAGISAAAGDIVAFVDDDAVPEPLWLHNLIAPFADATVSAAGGYVIGRNGFSFQWRGRMVFADGETAPLALSGDDPVVVQAGPGRAVKTEGTNMAMRRDVLVALGGFDPAFAFYMDETDLNMRLAATGARTAIVPLARVHHGYAASVRRTGDRVPRDLYEIAASTAVFLRKHGATAPTPMVPRDHQRQRVLRHMVAGDMMPGDVLRLLRRFDAGWRDGMARALSAPVDMFAPPPPFLPVAPMTGVHVVRSARFWKATAARAAARRDVQNGHRITLFLLSLSTLWHKAAFDPDGYWVHQGGQLGPSRRSDPWFTAVSARRRVRSEMHRLRHIRYANGPKFDHGE